MQTKSVSRRLRGAQSSSSRLPTIALFPGGPADEAGWLLVCEILRERGFAVRVLEPSATSFAADVGAARRILADEDGPVVLVGQSYGGAVITEAGSDRKVVALIYVAAFVPDAGESVAWLAQDPMASAQLTLALPQESLSGVVREPAWYVKPVWYLVAADDELIPARAQWAMAKRARADTTETGGGRMVCRSHAPVVASFIADAVSAAASAAKCA